MFHISRSAQARSKSAREQFRHCACEDLADVADLANGADLSCVADLSYVAD